MEGDIELGRGMEREEEGTGGTWRDRYMRGEALHGWATLRICEARYCYDKRSVEIKTNSSVLKDFTTTITVGSTPITVRGHPQKGRTRSFLAQVSVALPPARTRSRPKRIKRHPAVFDQAV